MQQTLTIKTDDLKPSLIEGLKKYFDAVSAKEITISFSTPKKKSLRHETQEEANTRIENAIKSMDAGNSISFSGDEFLQLTKVLSTLK